MVKENILAKSLKFVLKDNLLDILYWPVWWYTTGLKKALGQMKTTILQGNNELALTLWIKNLFVPMFAQYDWRGRIISFFMRLVNIIIRALIFLFWIIFSLIVFLFWLSLPIFLIFQVLYNLNLFGKLW
ncbi:hypothetical protein HQ571_00615 [Candidatus Kuenenbacteria bacterium]|nr:hypothetical protein [Candidatus Kuenenbacteria bacterium]